MVDAQGVVRVSTTNQNAQVAALRFHPNGQLVAVAARANGDPPNSGIRFLSAATGAVANEFGVSGVVFALAFSPDGSLFAAAHEWNAFPPACAPTCGTITVWRPPNPVPIWNGTQADNPLSLAISGRNVLAFGEMKRSGPYENNYVPSRVHLVQLPEGRPLRTLEGHVGTITAVAFAGEGDVLLTTSGGSTGAVNDASYTADNHSADNSLRFWRVSDGQELLKLEHLPVPYLNNQPSIRSLVVSPDTTRYAFAREDGLVAVARMPLFLTRSALTAAGFELGWIGGSGHYQVQQRASLTTGSWENAGAPIGERHITLPATTAISFVRVLSLDP